MVFGAKYDMPKILLNGNNILNGFIGVLQAFKDKVEKDKPKEKSKDKSNGLTESKIQIKPNSNYFQFEIVSRTIIISATYSQNLDLPLEIIDKFLNRQGSKYYLEIPNLESLNHVLYNIKIANLILSKKADPSSSASQFVSPSRFNTGVLNFIPAKSYISITPEFIRKMRYLEEFISFLSSDYSITTAGIYIKINTNVKLPFSSICTPYFKILKSEHCEHCENALILAPKPEFFTLEGLNELNSFEIVLNRMYRELKKLK